MRPKNHLTPLKQAKPDRPSRRWAVYFSRLVAGKLSDGRKFFATQAEAEAFCEVKRREVADLGINQAITLTDELKREVIECVRRLSLQSLGGRTPTLTQAVDCFIKETVMQGHNFRVIDAKGEWITHLQSSKKKKTSYTHLRLVKSSLAKFCEAFGEDILATVKGSKIEEWLDAYATAHQLKPKSRNAFLKNYLKPYFAWCVKRSFIESDPTAKIELWVDDAPLKDRLLSPDDLLLILSRTPRELLPTVAILSLVGLRVAEASRIRWEDVKADELRVEVGATISKTKMLRQSPIPGQVAKWLRKLKRKAKPTDFVFPAQVFVNQPDKAKNLSLLDANRQKHLWGALADVRIAVKGLGVDLKKNAFRASALSYRLALSTNAYTTAEEMGNSPSILKRRYQQLAPRALAVEWFAIDPSRFDDPFNAPTAPEILRTIEDKRAKAKLLENAEEDEGESDPTAPDDFPSFG